MLFNPPYLSYVLIVVLLISLYMFILTTIAYVANARRRPDDPQKRDYSPAAIIFVTLGWPALLLLYIGSHIVRRILVYVIALPLLLILNFLLAHFKKTLVFLLDQLEGKERLKRIFLRGGLALFILGNLFQLAALLVQDVNYEN